MTNADATRLSGGDSDATRFAGESYRTRLVQGAAITPDDKTRLAQEGYQSKLARDAANVQPDASEFYKVGDKIGDRYEVSAIHYGAMGVVYGCFDHETKLPRALKTVRSSYLHDKHVLSMFEDEATVWVSLEKHPYIVQAHLVKRFNNLPYVITDYVRGTEGMEGDLRGWLGHPRLTMQVAVAMALQIAQGMQHAVRKVPSLVHRDLKPGNILVNGDGKTMVTDFGLVNAADLGAGTPAYMSPEQWREEAFDMRSDIYAYGCMLFEMFTAHRMFPALTESDWEIAHLESTPTTLTSLVPELPGEIDQFVRCCIEKDVAARPQNWNEVVTFFAAWYHRLTGKAVVLDFSSLELDADERLRTISSFFSLARYKEVVFACERALEIDPNVPFVWHSMSLALDALKRYEEAIQANDRALAMDQNMASAWHVRSSILLTLKRYDEAIQANNREIAIDQNNSYAWFNKGRILYELRHYKDALDASERALAIDQNNAGAWAINGLAFDGLCLYEKAIQAYDRVLEISPLIFGFEVWFKKGEALRELKQYEEAIHAYDRVLAIDPNHVEAWVNRGNMLSELKRYDEAIQAYDKALSIDHNHVKALMLKGSALYKLKHYNEAIQAFDLAIEINPNTLFAHYIKGLIYRDIKNNNEEANLAFEQALSIDQNHVDALEANGGVLYRLKRYDKAIQYLDRALALAPNHVNGLITKGTALYKLNRYNEAIQVFDRILAIEPNNFLAWSKKGIALFNLNRYEESIQAQDRALEVDPNNAEALQARNSAVDALKAGSGPRYSWKRFWN
jgi:tetratricopeptide (TPR) repeat protein